MADYEYLNNLPLSDDQRKWFKGQGFKTAAIMYNAITYNRYDDMLHPLDVDSVRAMLWQMMDSSQREFHTSNSQDQMYSMLGFSFFVVIGLGLLLCLLCR
jgi:hypothetical protein